jgi:hypothetical protein
MKTNVKKLALVLFTLGTVAMGCKKEDEVQPANPAVVNQDGSGGPATVKKGFIVTSLYIKGSDVQADQNQAEKFKGWSLLFLDKGVLTAENSEGEKITGKWTSKESGDMETVVIDFGAAAPFNLLNNTWVVTKKTDTSKMMVDDDASDGLTASLVLEK